MTNFADKRWEDGIDHHPESIGLVIEVNKLDTDRELDLQYGGDGDIGDMLAYFLDELIDRGIITITINNVK